MQYKCRGLKIKTESRHENLFNHYFDTKEHTAATVATVLYNFINNLNYFINVMLDLNHNRYTENLRTNLTPLEVIVVEIEHQHKSNDEIILESKSFKEIQTLICYRCAHAWIYDKIHTDYTDINVTKKIVLYLREALFLGKPYANHLADTIEQEFVLKNKPFTLRNCRQFIKGD